LAERLRQRADEGGFIFARRAVVGVCRGRFANSRLCVLQQAPGRKAAELLEELRTEKGRRIGKAQTAALGLRLMGEALGNDEARFFRRPAFAQEHRA